jgi:hypothetical protein
MPFVTAAADVVLLDTVLDAAVAEVVVKTLMPMEKKR